jgi:hypothetical protein
VPDEIKTRGNFKRLAIDRPCSALRRLPYGGFDAERLGYVSIRAGHCVDAMQTDTSAMSAAAGAAHRSAELESAKTECVRRIVPNRVQPINTFRWMCVAPQRRLRNAGSQCSGYKIR